jgi:hypothetical protein
MSRRAIPVLIALVMLAGCGDDKKDSAAASASSSTTQTTAEATTTTAAPTTTTTSGGLSESSKLRMDGIGPVKVGMTLAEATAAVGKPVTAGANSPSDNCNLAKVEDGPPGLTFLVERDKPTDPWHIARVDITSSSKITTVANIRVGSTEEEVRKAYSPPAKSGTIKVEAHKYVDGGHYITYDEDGPTGLLLLFETNGTKVTQFRSGQQGPVGYVEGCA